MKLMLEKDVKNLGKAGDEVSVKPGYARNYLLPKKLATTLNESRLKEWKHKKHIIEVRKKKAEEEREKTISHLNKIHLVFEKEARGQGQLFGSVSSGEISKALEEKHSLSVDKRDIFSDPIKTIGEHKVKIVLDPIRETFLSITVKKTSSKKESAETGKASSHYSKNLKKEEVLQKTPSSSQEAAPSLSFLNKAANSGSGIDEKPPDTEDKNN